MSAATANGECKLMDVRAVLTKSLSESWIDFRRQLVSHVNGLFDHEKQNFVMVFMMVILSAFLYLVVYHGWIASALVGIAYPAYATIARVLKPQTTEVTGKGNFVTAKTKWLVYWTIFAMVWILESPVTAFLNAIKPLYYLLRMVFFVWCFAPIENNGTEIVYGFVVWLLVRKNRYVKDAPSNHVDQ
ncbi:TB2/DP1/HVA22-related protein [Cinara cedri]|uniref:Receptor expression-enhancing protein n=1 Tax=Cinara cedri TaxID=506608 RepID=A0A5E4N5P1_9HEMI|nr:TB2/DP1/HVA22-related protein [Cinara cedri]